MEYEIVDELKQSERGVVQLIREKVKGQYFIRKVLKGQYAVYLLMQCCRHPCLPRLYEVSIADGSTIVIEEYIEGHMLGCEKLSPKQFLGVVKDLCSVLEYLHGMHIIHRDIKPSNVICAEDGHIRLIDFDAARIQKSNQGDQEQDTRLLGTRGYAPPEQYGFAPTDVRTDIYALGVTLEQVMQSKVQKVRYGRIIRKCKNLNPEKRYQSVHQVKKAFFHMGQSICCGLIALMLAVCLGISVQEGIFQGFGSSLAEKYPDQILWKNIPVRDYLGRSIDDIMDEMEKPFDDYSEGGEENICSYRESGIVFCFNGQRKVYLVVIDPSFSTINGKSLQANQKRLIELLGNPLYAGWSERKVNGEMQNVYYMDFYEEDTKAGIAVYMSSPEEEADTIYID